MNRVVSHHCWYFVHPYNIQRCHILDLANRDLNLLEAGARNVDRLGTLLVAVADNIPGQLGMGRNRLAWEGVEDND